MSHVNEFVKNTDYYFNECNEGFTRLNKIIVSVASDELASWSRAYLIPAVYAYWERFFRQSLEEFSKALRDSDTAYSEINVGLLARIKRRELQNIVKDLNILQENYLNNISLEKITNDISSFQGLLDQVKTKKLDIVDPKDLVKTYSNVKFETLKKNFNFFCLSLTDIIGGFNSRGINIKTKLDEFVDARNGIGHGGVINPINSEEWNKYIELILSLMHYLQNSMLDALEKRGEHSVFPKVAPLVSSVPSTV